MAFWNRSQRRPAAWNLSGHAETRAATSGLARPAGWLQESLMSGTTPSGQSVTVEKALGIGPVWSAVTMISEQVGQLPFKVYRLLDGGDGEVERVEARQHRAWQLLHDKPNSHTPADRFWATATMHLLVYGNAFIRKSRDVSTGLVSELFLLDPAAVTVAYNPLTADKRFLYYPQNMVERPAEYDDGDVLHVFRESLDGIVGESVVTRGRTTLGTAMARDEYEGGFYRRGATLAGGIQHPGRLSPEAAKNLSQSFKALHGGSPNAFGTPVFEEGAQFVKIGSVLKDLEFVAAQNLSRTDIATMFHLPPNYLGGSSGDSLTYATVESNQLHYALHSISPLTNTISKAVSNDPGILPQNVFQAEFVLEAMLRGDATGRVAYYKAMKDMGAMTVDEIRAKENLPALSTSQRAELAPAPSPSPPFAVNGGRPSPIPLPGASGRLSLAAPAPARLNP